ncbi:MAG: hypothetical protein IJ246_14110 [Clostridia bacterium]|nr:hypothetical protein [Clostridia bacterium]
MREDTIRLVDEVLPMEDDEGETVDLNIVAYIVKDDVEYAIVLDPEDEGGIMVFETSVDEEGMDFFIPVEDMDLAEQLFYLYDAHSESYEFGPAT